MLKVFTWFLRLGALGLWAFWYMFVMSMACAFGPPSGNCQSAMPWELNGDDLSFLVIQPAILVGLVFLMAWWLERRFGRKS